MANISFTRDEVILTLDVLYFSGEKHLNENAPSIIALCSLLQDLPIHPHENRNQIFRNPHGVSKQIAGFRRSCETGNHNPSIGSMFFTVAFEYEDKKNELHEIAEAIRRNQAYFKSSFGSIDEGDGFPEGALLAHMHRLIEKRSEQKISKADHCAICQLEPKSLYQPCGDLLQLHLTVDPKAMDGAKKYSLSDFITVCPTCHAALHRYRPWLGRENREALLRD